MFWWICATVGVLFGLMAFTGAPYVPSRRKDIRQAFERLYDLGESDTLVDIGSGGGGVLREARRHGARAYGIELNPILVWCARVRSWGDKKTTILCNNLYRADFPSETTVVYVFGDSRDIERMARAVRRQATRLHRPLWLISYAFEIPNEIAVKTHGAHFLYQIKPFTESKP